MTTIDDDQAGSHPVAGRPMPPVDETGRLAALHIYRVLDTPDEAQFDDLATLAAQLCDTPIAFVSLVDHNRQWFKSKVGVNVCQTDRDVSFCVHALRSHDVLVVPDARLDSRFSDNAFVVGAPFIRFYAGAPLIDPDGYVLGTLCVLDTQPRDLSVRQLDQLAALSRQVMAQLTLTRRKAELDAEVERRRESEHQWRTLFQNSPIGAAIADESGRFVKVNDALCQMLGLEYADLVGRRGADLSFNIDQLQHELANEMIADSVNGVSRIHTRFGRPDGEIGWASITIARTPGPAGECWTLAYIEDITGHKAAELALTTSEANLAAVARVVKQIQTGGDARQTVVSSVRELADTDSVSLLELSHDQTALVVTASTTPTRVGSTIPIDATSATVSVFHSGTALFIADPEQHPLVSRELLARSGARSAYAAPVRSLDGTVGVLQVTWNHRVASLDDQRVSVVTLLSDHVGVALRQAALLTELQALAVTDPLTTLPNRRGWDQTIRMLIARAQRSGCQLTVALADLDHFKLYNDAFGHSAGDVLLRDFAETARGALRTDDIVSRWGGEEFAIALPECPIGVAEAVLARVRLAVPEDQTCSIGYATWDGLESAEQLLARADEALYAAKETGRNQVVGAIQPRLAS